MRIERTILILLAVLLVLLHGGSAAGQERRRIPKDRAPAKVMDPMIVFRGIERAWRAGDAQKLAGYAGKSKVLLNVRGLGEKGGYYSRSQAFYLFKDMFESTKHTKFDFVGFHEVGEKSTKIYGVARRNYETTSNGRLFQDKIFVTLKLEGKRWVISEMKSAR